MQLAQATEQEILGACVWAPQKVDMLRGVKVQQVVIASWKADFSSSMICVAKAGLHMAVSSRNRPSAF